MRFQIIIIFLFPTPSSLSLAAPATGTLLLAIYNVYIHQRSSTGLHNYYAPYSHTYGLHQNIVIILLPYTVHTVMVSAYSVHFDKAVLIIKKYTYI